MHAYMVSNLYYSCREQLPHMKHRWQSKEMQREVDMIAKVAHKAKLPMNVSIEFNKPFCNATSPTNQHWINFLEGQRSLACKMSTDIVVDP